MQQFGQISKFPLSINGIEKVKSAYWNLPHAVLVEEALARQEGVLSQSGALMVNTGEHTGRSPNDKYIVQFGTDDESEIWWGKVNQPISAAKAKQIHAKLITYLEDKDVFVQDLRAAAHPAYHVAIRVITTKAWTGLFSTDLFIRPTMEERLTQKPEYTILHCPDFYANPNEDGILSPTFIILDLKSKLILVGGTGYAGEVKKSVFTLMNYLLPKQGVLSMHCSANVGQGGDVALFFGLSGTGKTTLSSDPERSLIGDDEHGWSDEAVFNIEGGCYAKTIRLSEKYEPIIWGATHRFGAVLENVVYDAASREIDFNSDALTENTRGAYPITFVSDHVDSGYASHPKNIFFLTADAFGVLPPLAKLTPQQAMYYFLSGYTSKLAGTEKGLGAEPQATFSTCFGAPFLPLKPTVYAELLGKKIAEHKVNVWLINTGWTGGPYGVGKRIHLPHTRSMVRAALSETLRSTPFIQEPHFRLWVPEECPDVPAEILLPEKTWTDAAAYTASAARLVSLFVKNFEQYKSGVGQDVVLSGPQLV